MHGPPVDHWPTPFRGDETGSNRISLARAVAVVLVTLMAAAQVGWAAFVRPKWEFIGLPVGPNQSTENEDTVVLTLQHHYGGSEVTNRTRLENAKKNFQTAIDMVYSEFGYRGRQAQKLFNRGRIDLDIGESSAYGAADIDDMTLAHSDSINVKAGWARINQQLHPSDPAAWRLFLIMDHEAGTHATQGYPHRAANLAGFVARVERGREMADNEIVAHRRNADCSQRLIDGLDNVAAGKPHGQIGAPAAAIDDLLDRFPNPGPDRNHAVNSLRNVASRELDNDRASVKFYSQMRGLAHRFLTDPSYTEAQYRADAQRLNVPSSYRRAATSARPELAVGLEVGSSTLRQYDETTGESASFDLGIPSPLDALGTDGGLLVSGLDQNGLGTLGLFVDSDSDGWFDAGSTDWLALGATNLTGCLSLARNPLTSEAYVFDNPSGLIYCVEDLLQPVIPGGIGEMSDIRSIGFNESGDIFTLQSLFGTEEISGTTSPALLFEDTDQDGYWETVTVSDMREITEIEPGFSTAVMAGDSSINVIGDELNEVSLYTTDQYGENRQLIGTGILTADACTEIPLFAGVELHAGDFVLIHDEFLGYDSVVTEVLIPEPGTALLLILGLGACSLVVHRRSDRGQSAA